MACAPGCERQATGTPASREAAPAHLAGTGLWADASTRTPAPGVFAFAPQYPLWTDGATKRRFIALPPGASIDARDVDHWEFPAGTRLWKEFTFAAGRETRFMRKRADGSWLYATYVTTDLTGGDGELAPEAGIPGFTPTRDGRSHDVPSGTDCRLCHESGRTAVLGFSALQLSPDRDPLAPNATTPPTGAVDLATLAARGLVRNLPARFLATPPRTAGRTPTERAVLGYLHGNCASCHNADGPMQRLGLRFDHPLAGPDDRRTGSRGNHAGCDAAARHAHAAPPALTSTLGVPSQFTRATARQRVVAGSPAESTLFVRLTADDPLGQMPPFGRHLVDRAAAELVERWIRFELPASSSNHSVLSDPSDNNTPKKP